VRRERRNLSGLCGEEYVGIYKEGICAVAHWIGEGSRRSGGTSTLSRERR
jgi:hypothetical protein